MTTLNPVGKTRSKTFELVLIAMMSALVFVATSLLNVKLPFGHGGLIHLGTAMLFIAALLFGPKVGALAGMIGMGLFDLLGGWLVWFPITIVARFLQGYVVGKIAWSNGAKGDQFRRNLIATIASVPVMLAVYYVGQAIMFDNWIAPLASVPGNVAQNVIGLLIAIPTAAVMKRRFF